MDQGLLGPGSVAWTVVGHPMSLVGGMRALMIQTLHPLAMAGVAQHSDYERRGLDRLRRTAYYVTATTFGDTDTAHAAAERVRRVHRRIHGIDPVTGRPYDAADPDTQIWVHCTEWHSMLAAYRVFGDRRLSEREQDRYFAEGAIIGSLLGTPRERIPASRAEYRAYFEAVRPQLCVSEASRKAINFVLRPPVDRETLHLQGPIRLFGSAAVALVPRHLRVLAGIDRPRWQDAASVAAVRPFATALTLPGIRDLPRVVFGGDVHAIAVRARHLSRAS
ncbi:MAG TPA: oxygenase MpaB family protein [Actinoplanes sp.]|nr:oxygenase MpaB family protein [Actinoplanes sp.]